MKASLSEIADYVRGLASSEVTERIESDPESLQAASGMQHVVETAQLEPQKNWVLRAKALLVNDVQTLPILFGRLVPRAAGQGFRSSGGSSHLSTYQFKSFTVDLVTKSIDDKEKLRVSGVIEGGLSAMVRVGTADQWLTVSDEEGQFMMDVPIETTSIRLQAVDMPQIYQLEIKTND